MNPFALGTVQFGLAYGRNQIELDEASVFEILSVAVESGIHVFDTARAYGLSERRLGAARKSGILSDSDLIVTKLATDLGFEGEPDSLVAERVRTSLADSRECLGKEFLDGVLLHRFEHYSLNGGLVWEILREQKRCGTVGHIGVSVSNPEEAVQALQDSDLTWLQYPFNILDWRWQKEAFKGAVAARPEVSFHCRSLFLQGILLLAPEVWPKIEGVSGEEILEALDFFSERARLKDRKDLLWAYINSKVPRVTPLVGVQSVTELQENIGLAGTRGLSLALVAEIEAHFEKLRLPEALLNPARWLG